MGNSSSKLNMASIDKHDPYKDLVKDVRPMAIGAFGTVYRCRGRKHESFVCAVKDVTVPSNEADSVEINRMIDREQSVVGRLIQLGDHPNILKIFFSTRTASNFCIFMEYLDGGDLRAFIDRNGAQTKEALSFFLTEIMKGLRFLHSNQIAHYDMKSSNILLNHIKYPKIVKICDYGMSKNFSGEDDISRTASYRGTVPFMSPEVVDCYYNRTKKADEKSTFSRKSDIWSLGVIGLHLIAGVLTSRRTDDVLGELDRYSSWNHQNKPAIDVLKCLLVVDPQNRCDVDEAMLLIEIAAKLPLPKVTCDIEFYPSKDKRECNSQLVNYFTLHHSEDNAIQGAVQIIEPFYNRNWFVVSCNQDDDVLYNDAINVKVDDRQHLFYWYYDRPEWNNETEASVASYLKYIQWTTKSAFDVTDALDNHFSGSWECVISSKNNTKVYGNNINVTLNNGNKFITVYKDYN